MWGFLSLRGVEPISKFRAIPRGMALKFKENLWNLIDWIRIYRIYPPFSDHRKWSESQYFGIISYDMPGERRRWKERLFPACGSVNIASVILSRFPFFYFFLCFYYVSMKCYEYWMNKMNNYCVYSKESVHPQNNYSTTIWLVGFRICDPSAPVPGSGDGHAWVPWVPWIS